MFRKLSLFGVVLTLVIILLGSFARLSGLELTAPVIDILKGSVHVGLSSISALLTLVLFLLSWRFQPRKIAVITTSLVIVLLISLQSALGFGRML